MTFVRAVTRSHFIDSLREQLEQATQWKPIVAGAAVLERGLLDAEGLKAEIERAQENFAEQAQERLEGIRAAASKVIEGAEAKAREIEGKARLTAEGISLEAAQKQFKEAADHDAKQVKLWTFLAGISILTLIAGALLFVVVTDFPKLPANSDWKTYLPFTLLKIFVLSALAGMTTFMFRMLRAHLHIAEKNRHRVRVANSIESILQSAGDSSQRDLILAKLADSIVNYRDSGLVQHEREDHSATMSGDLMGRIVAAISGKGS